MKIKIQKISEANKNLEANPDKISQTQLIPPSSAQPRPARFFAHYSPATINAGHSDLFKYIEIDASIYFCRFHIFLEIIIVVADISIRCDLLLLRKSSSKICNIKIKTFAKLFC